MVNRMHGKKRPRNRKKPSEHGFLVGIRGFFTRLLGKEKPEIVEPTPPQKKERRRGNKKKRQTTQPVIEIKPKEPTEEEKRLAEEERQRRSEEDKRKHLEKVAARKRRRTTKKIELEKLEAEQLRKEQEQTQEPSEFEILLNSQFGSVELSQRRQAEVQDPKEFEKLLNSQPTSEVQELLAEKKSEGEGFAIPTKKEVLRELTDIDEDQIPSLDLHNVHSEKAQWMVYSFVKRNKNSGSKFALIITGKGKNSENGKAVLKPMVRETLSTYVKLGKISFFAVAPNKFGGEGAFIVVFN